MSDAAEPAVFVDGFLEGTERKGSRRRLTGYNKGYEPLHHLVEADMDNARLTLAGAKNMGMPAYIEGNPLGCGCQIAHLHAVGAVLESHMEADYMCDSGWHNFVLFKVRAQDNRSDNSIKVNTSGELVAEQGVSPGELEEF